MVQLHGLIIRTIRYLPGMAWTQASLQHFRDHLLYPFRSVAIARRSAKAASTVDPHKAAAEECDICRNK